MKLMSVQLSATEEFVAYDYDNNTFSIYYTNSGVHGADAKSIPFKYLNQYVKLVSQIERLTLLK